MGLNNRSASKLGGPQFGGPAKEKDGAARDYSKSSVFQNSKTRSWPTAKMIFKMDTLGGRSLWAAVLIASGRNDKPLGGWLLINARLVGISQASSRSSTYIPH